MIYFDNAATGGFKPSEVKDSVTQVIKYLSANPARSGHRLAVAGEKLVNLARKEISEYFNNGNPDRVVFTKNCTEALNVALFGIIKKGMKVLTTVFEHNAVLRPLYELERRRDIILTVLSPESADTLEDEAIEKGKDYDVIVMTAASNVTGKVFDVEKVGKAFKGRTPLFIVDGAQGAGHIKYDMKEFGIDVFCFSGHKGMYGVMGSGCLAFTNDVEIDPLIYGGTGTDTFLKGMPPVYPEKLEGGTLSLPCIVSLLEGTLYVKENTEYFANISETLTDALIKKLQKINGVTLYSQKNKTGIVSFNIYGTDSNLVGDMLNEKYDVAVRCGFHCAPLCHEYLGTQNIGTVRASLSPHNTIGEINTFASSVKELARAVN